MNYNFDYQPGGGEPISFDPITNVRRERRQFASIALGVSFIVLFATIVQILAVSVIRAVAPQVVEYDWFVIVLSMVPMYAVAMPLSLFLFRMGKAEPPTEKRDLSPLLTCGLICLCFCLTYVGNFIGIFVNFIISMFTGEPPTNDLQELTVNTPFWANLLFAGILAPILEELFYRKLVIDRLRRYGDFTAILLSGLLFGAIHGNFYQFFYATLMGFVFGYVYLYTGKLRYSVILHMSVNLLGGVLMTEVAKRLDLAALSADPVKFVLENGTVMGVYLLYLFFLFACFIIAPITVILVWRHIRFRKGEVKLTASQLRDAFFLNPAVWLLLAVVALLFFG